MININTIHKYFIISIFLSGFLVYFTGNSLIAYGPTIIFMLLIVFFEVYLRKGISHNSQLAVISWFPFVFLASFYYLLNPYEGKYITANFLIILSLPIMVLSTIRLKDFYNNIDYINFSYKLICYFLFFELLVCLGQMSTYIFGFGFPVQPEYMSLFIVSGSFNNPNDLASLVLLITFSFICFEKKIDKNKRTFIWLLVFTLIFFSGSRSTTFLVILMFLFFRGFKFRQILSYSFVLLAISTTYYTLASVFSNEAFSYFFNRLDSLFVIISEGSQNDGSVTLRLDSYRHFIKNIPNLGLGSGEIGNYHEYARSANFPTDLMFENPHSLIVEVGYWLGILGILFLSIPILYLLSFSNKKILLLLVFLVSSSISSSVLDSFIYFYMLIFCFFISIVKPT